MMDLTTTYMGLELRSPLVASSSPLTGDPYTLARLQDAGVGAVVLPSLFEEQITHDAVELDSLWSTTSEQYAEALSYFPDLQATASEPQRHLELVENARRAVSVPVIASLNGITPAGWARYARDLVDAGANAIELNLYTVATDPEVPAADLEAQELELVALVRQSVRVPVAVKLSPFYTSLANFAVRVVRAGADGLVLCNRFYQPDLDLDELDVVPRLVLSTSDELRLPLRWVAILDGHVPASLAVTSGVHTGLDAAKAILAGASAVMTTSALLRHGPAYVEQLERQLVDVLDEHDHTSVRQARGSMSRRAMPDPAGYERANYMRTLQSWSSRQDAGPEQRAVPGA